MPARRKSNRKQTRMHRSKRGHGSKRERGSCRRSNRAIHGGGVKALAHNAIMNLRRALNRRPLDDMECYRLLEAYGKLGEEFAMMLKQQPTEAMFNDKARIK